MASLVVPREFYATKEQSHPVNGNLVVFLKGCLEVIEIGCVRYFDAEVINNEAKGDGLPHVMPQSALGLLANLK